jgi:thiol-disulfide isomerase/thioredoxin
MTKHLLITILTAALLSVPLRAESPAEQQVSEAIKAQGVSVVHLWAPWCGNCQAELKSGGWSKTVKDNPEVTFYFVSVWNSGQDGRSMLVKYEIAQQPNVDLQRGRPSLRFELRRSPLRDAPAIDR